MNEEKLHPEDLLLDYYHCTFFLPLIGLQEQGFEPKQAPFSYHPACSTELSEAQAQAYHYFSPALRNILFDTGIGDASSYETKLTPVKEWRLPLDQDPDVPWLMQLGKEEEKDDPLRYQIARITSVTLYRYFNGIYMLAFRAEPQALIQLRETWNPLKQRLQAEAAKTYPEDWDKQHGWVQDRLDEQGCSLFSRHPPRTIDDVPPDDPDLEQYLQLRMDSWLRFTRLARLIYPSFPEQNDERKISPIRLQTPGKTVTAFAEKMAVTIPDPPGKRISALIRHLLGAFFDVSEQRIDRLLDHYCNLYDDRMFVSVAYGLTHSCLPDKDLERLFSLATYVDQQADTFEALEGYAYTPEEIRKRLESTSLRLWQGMGGLYGYTGFSNAYLYNGIFFREIVAPGHVVWIYDRMLLQALFYQASLRHYDQRICNETESILQRRNLEDIRAQRKEFIRFTNQYWFHQLTNQSQGREIFQLQQQAIGLNRQYEIIKDELERTDEYLQTEHEIHIARASDRLTFWGFIVAVTALYYTALPMLQEHLTSTKGMTGEAWRYLCRWIGCTLTDEFTLLMILLFALPLIFFLFFLMLWLFYKHVFLRR